MLTIKVIGSFHNSIYTSHTCVLPRHNILLVTILVYSRLGHYNYHVYTLYRIQQKKRISHCIADVVALYHYTYYVCCADTIISVEL